MAKEKRPYYEFLAECIRAAGQNLVDHAEEYAGTKDLITNCDINIEFNQSMNYSIPRIYVNKEYCLSMDEIGALLEKETKDGDS